MRDRQLVGVVDPYLNGGPALAATTAAVALRAGHLAGTKPAERQLSQEVHLRPGSPPAHPTGPSPTAAARGTEFAPVSG